MQGLDVRNMTVGALLLALSLIIPMAFGGVLGVVIGPFSATLASHVPIYDFNVLWPVCIRCCRFGLGNRFLFETWAGNRFKSSHAHTCRNNRSFAFEKEEALSPGAWYNRVSSRCPRGPHCATISHFWKFKVALR